MLPVLYTLPCRLFQAQTLELRQTKREAPPCDLTTSTARQLDRTRPGRTIEILSAHSAARLEARAQMKNAITGSKIGRSSTINRVNN